MISTESKRSYIMYIGNQQCRLCACSLYERWEDGQHLDLYFICEKKLDFTQLTKSFKIEHVQQNTIDFRNRFSIGSWPPIYKCHLVLELSTQRWRMEYDENCNNLTFSHDLMGLFAICWAGYDLVWWSI